MNRHILYVSPRPHETDPPSAWHQNLIDENFAFLHVNNARQAKTYIENYSLVGILIEVDESPEESVETVRELTRLPGASGVPFIGIIRESLAPGEKERLAEAGLCGLVADDTPPSFLHRQFKNSQELQHLRTLQEDGVDIRELAKQTRNLMHDLSQPLAALQGRLQLMQSKAEGEKELQEALGRLVSLSMDVSKHLYELQELQRKYS